MKHRTAAHLENAEINRSARVFLLPVPMKIHNEREIVARGTRSIDPQYDQGPRFSLFQKQLMALFIVAACAFLLAFEVGLVDWIFK